MYAFVSLTRVNIHRIRLPRLPVDQLVIPVQWSLGKRLAFRQFLGQIGRSLFGQRSHHTSTPSPSVTINTKNYPQVIRKPSARTHHIPNRIGATPHVLLHWFGDCLQQPTVTIEMPNRFDRGHITGQDIVRIHTRMEQPQLQRLAHGVNEIAATVDAVEDLLQVIDDRLRVWVIYFGCCCY